MGGPQTVHLRGVACFGAMNENRLLDENGCGTEHRGQLACEAVFENPRKPCIFGSFAHDRVRLACRTDSTPHALPQQVLLSLKATDLLLPSGTQEERVDS